MTNDPPILSPCPFCGVAPTVNTSTVPGVVFVECLHEPCPAQPTVARKTIEDAAAAWNQRAPAN